MNGYSGTGLLAVLVERQFQVWNLKERPPRLVDRMKLANAFEMTDDGTSGRLEISRNAEVVAFIASGAIQLWHRKQSNQAEVLLQLKSSGDVSGMLALSPDGSLIAASQAGLISLGDTSKPDWIAGQEWEPWDAGEKTSDLCFSPDGRFMAARSEFGKAAVWTLSDPTAEPRVWEAALGQGEIIFAHKRERLFTYGARGSAKAWDLHSLQQVCTFPHELAVSSIAISPDDETLAISSSGHRGAVLRLFRAPKP